MDKSATVEMLLLRGQIMRTQDPAIRGELQRQFDEALAALRLKAGALPPEVPRAAERTRRAHPLYRRG